MNLDIRKLEYLLSDMENYLIELAENVLSDSKTDPHFFAVYTTNMIKCFIQISEELGDKCPYSDVKSFFKFNGFTAEEYEAFEKRRKEESEYYRGVQF